ncbi:hypothetical protein [Streptomyces sp. NPDC007063]|uniref:hypothetical protein n=1 Tax=Streptomyces sp. NPDC007063 TaxID=3364772 RepID=UPI00368BDD69
MSTGTPVRPGPHIPGAADPGAHPAAALAAADTDRIVFDLAGIERSYDALCRELPGVRVRFVMMACPVDEVLVVLARRGAGVDAAGPNEVRQALREGMAELRRTADGPLGFVVEPGRHLVADHGAIRARVSRLARRRAPDGEEQYWLYLSCGKFNGLHEMDAVQDPLVFPGHTSGPHVPAVVAGSTCDSDDAYSAEHGLAPVPRALASGAPVWVLSCGAYATSYTTRGFNGIAPLPLHCTHAPGRPTGPRPASSSAPVATGALDG